MDIFDSSLYINKVYTVIHNKIHKGRIRTFSDVPRYSNCFAYILKGSTKYVFFNGKQTLAEEGTILFLSKNERYFMEVLSDDYEFIFFDFEFSEDEKIDSDVFINFNPNINELFNLMNVENQSILKSKNALLMKLANDILYNLFESNNKTKIENNGHFNKLLRDINKHYCDSNYNVHALSKNTNTSETQIRRLFKKYESTTPNEYINSLRFEKANFLLLIKENNISEISYMCGFANIHYFSTAFKKKYGISPKHLLKINNNVISNDTIK